VTKSKTCRQKAKTKSKAKAKQKAKTKSKTYRQKAKRVDKKQNVETKSKTSRQKAKRRDKKQNEVNRVLGPTTAAELATRHEREGAVLLRAPRQFRTRDLVKRVILATKS
jgi:hypothetical protein